MKKVIKKVKYNNFIFTDSHPDNTILLIDETIAVI